MWIDVCVDGCGFVRLSWHLAWSFFPAQHIAWIVAWLLVVIIIISSMGNINISHFTYWCWCFDIIKSGIVCALEVNMKHDKRV